ncbi:MAG: hypothetical protein HQL77_14060 [Magnetococcales bacterium]|nr:hypothetical protein [Magnetococcales bacterium]
MSMGVREYARHRRVTHTAVEKAIKSGRIQKEADGSIDPVKADAAWGRNTSQAQQRKQEPVFVKPPPPPVRHPVTRPADPDAVPSGSAIPNYHVSRAVRETYNAKLTRLDYEERMGKLLKGEDVAAEAYASARRARDRLLGIPSRVAAVLASETDSKAIERLLEQELRIALEELSR